MKEDELVDALQGSLARRVTLVDARPDPDALLARIDRRSTRQRSWLVAAVVVVLFVGGIAGYVIGSSSPSDSKPAAIAARSDGTPPVTAPNGPQVQPADPIAARAQITQAFQNAFSGQTSADVKDQATQDGPALRELRHDVFAYAEQHGYAADQLGGTTVTVLAVDFIDQTHAAVRFTINVPGRGSVLVDKVGYAVVDGGEWKVALRTACDLLALDGVIGACPPNP